MPDEKPIEELQKAQDNVQTIDTAIREIKGALDISPLEEAKNILDENKKLLLNLTEERKRIEKAAANMMVSGRGFAGSQLREETEDEKWRREAKIRYAGTGIDPT